MRFGNKRRPIKDGTLGPDTRAALSGAIALRRALEQMRAIGMTQQQQARSIEQATRLYIAGASDELVNVLCSIAATGMVTPNQLVRIIAAAREKS